MLMKALEENINLNKHLRNLPSCVGYELRAEKREEKGSEESRVLWL